MLTNEQAQDVAARVIQIRHLKRKLTTAEANGAKQAARDPRRAIADAEAEIEALIAQDA